MVWRFRGVVREGPVMMMVSVVGLLVWPGCGDGRVSGGHFDISRLITRELTRKRRLFIRRGISAVVSMMASANRSGGKGRLVGDLAADHP